MSPFWTVVAASTLLGAAILALLAWEVRVAGRRGRAIATPGWTWSNARLRRAAHARRSRLVQGALVAGYAAVADRVDWTWHVGWWTWLLGFVAIDLAEYLSHRASHALPVMWAMHAVHHQSPEYNLSLNFRLGVLGPLTGFPFHLLLALAGVPTAMFVVLLPLQAAGMIFTHARFPRTLGVFGLVLNAPAWHRVHHSALHAHRDRNYGAVLIVWDRWLGTFTDGADVEPRWGVDDELEARDVRDPIAANLAPWRALSERIRRRGLRALWRWD